MWQQLESMYERKTSMNKSAVIKMLAKLEYRDGDNVIEHLNVFKCHINQLSAMKISFHDELLIHAFYIINIMTHMIGFECYLSLYIIIYAF
jgi:hypothetical protein